MGMMGPGMGMMGRGMRGGPLGAEAKQKLRTLTRTDFLLQFVWQPEVVEEVPSTPEEQQALVEERTAKMREIIEKMREAEKANAAVTVPREDEIEKASDAKTEEVEKAITDALGGEAAAAPNTGAEGSDAPAAGAPATPAPTP